MTLLLKKGKAMPTAGNVAFPVMGLENKKEHIAARQNVLAIFKGNCVQCLEKKKDKSFPTR
jgi:mono/diheme cytochrome c family protein